MKNKNINLMLVQPPNYVHTLALHEAIEYIYYNLINHGYRVKRTSNFIANNACNIIFCAHLLSEKMADALPEDVIIFNSEQLTDITGWHFSYGVYEELLDKHYVWDYSKYNLLQIKHNNKSFIPFLYCSELNRSNIRREKGEYLLFYGSLSERRKRILQDLHNNGIPVKVIFGQYGIERDTEMFKCRAVLNLHKQDRKHAFQAIRCFHPLINGIPVVSEEVDDDTADLYRDSICFVESTNFVQRLRELYTQPDELTHMLHKITANFRDMQADSIIGNSITRWQKYKNDIDELSFTIQ